MQQEHGHVAWGKDTAHLLWPFQSIGPRVPTPAPQRPLYVPGLHTGCYPTVPQPMVFHVPLKGSVTTPILATRQLTPSLQARTTPPIQETGTWDLPMPLLIAGVDGEASVGVGTRA